MTSDAHITTIDPEVAGQAVLPSAPDSGVLLVHVPGEFGDVCAWHLLDFARRWRQEGREVHLCDACLDAPILHHAADVENAEGVTDAILYGSSVSRISVPVEKGVLLTTAGTVVGDTARVLEHPRWASIAAAVTDAGGLLVVTVPSGTDASRLDGLADAVLRFVPGVAGGADTYDGDPTADASSSPAASETDRAAAAADTDRSATEPAAATSPAAAASLRLARTTARESSGNRGLVILILVLLGLLGAFGAGYFGLVEIPGITPADVDLVVDLVPLR